MEKDYPLIIVFYLYEDMMRQPDIIQPFAESINNLLAAKNANAMAFFIPTKDNERVECINPMIVKEADMDKINKMVQDIKESFSVGVDINVPDEEITLDDKPCDCGNNPDGNCKC
jgi:intergrase/recombinase